MAESVRPAYLAARQDHLFVFYMKECRMTRELAVLCHTRPDMQVQLGVY